jgi:hypothetical protein
MNIRSYLSGAAATVFVLVGSASVAQQGTTTGPATGADVAPSTAVQKQSPATATQSVGEQAKEGATAAGAPGVTADPGTQGGPPPQAPKAAAAGEQAKEAAPAVGAPGVSAQPGTQGGPPPAPSAPQ